MIPVLRAKDGVQFAKIAPAGFRLLAALDKAVLNLNMDLVITSGTDGEHSGPADPHHTGEAYDVRSQNISNKNAVLLGVLSQLGHPTPVDGGGYATAFFFGWLEDAGTPNEHFHFQRRRGVVYPPVQDADLSLQGDV